MSGLARRYICRLIILIRLIGLRQARRSIRCSARPGFLAGWRFPLFDRGSGLWITVSLFPGRFGVRSWRRVRRFGQVFSGRRAGLMRVRSVAQGQSARAGGVIVCAGRGSGGQVEESVLGQLGTASHSWP